MFCLDQSQAENLLSKQSKYKDQTYTIIKYDKSKLDNYHSLSGLFRSVIKKNDKLCVFSPPKSLKLEYFKTIYKENDCYAEELVEGTMVNLFFDTDTLEWEIATKSVVGGETCYFKNGVFKPEDTFRYMFFEVCKEVNLDFSQLSKDFCYSFVFQHPRNKIVIPFTTMSLYLIATYKLNSTLLTATIFSHSQINEYFINSQVKYPKSFSFTSYNDLKEYRVSKDPIQPGLSIYHVLSGMRTTIRNDKYEYIKRLRGNQSKLQFRYLEFRNMEIMGNTSILEEYLYYFPESRNDFILFNEDVKDFSTKLYENYIYCYIKKEKKLIECPYEFRFHMYNLHQYYIYNLRQVNMFINKDIVTTYVNNLPPAKLMYSLNYSKNKK
jgi:hypothetical protein